jgi:5-(carboxyamino)imidazole ribonucleotide synthase
LSSLEAAVAELGRPCVIKTAAFGYDGKGQCKVTAETNLAEAWSGFVGHRAVVEQWVSFVCEVSVVGARGIDGSMATHGCVENQHTHHILDVTIAPARVEPQIIALAVELWKAVAEGLDYVGTMAVEMFVTTDGKVIVNEIAPRPHNSGHYTIDACRTNQFQQQQRAVCGLPLGDASQHTPAVMINLLGDIWPAPLTHPDWSPVLNHPRAKLHLYGNTFTQLFALLLCRMASQSLTSWWPSSAVAKRAGVLLAAGDVLVDGAVVHLVASLKPSGGRRDSR